jgi:hypothetical protein
VTLEEHILLETNFREIEMGFDDKAKKIGIFAPNAVSPHKREQSFEQTVGIKYAIKKLKRERAVIL